MSSQHPIFGQVLIAVLGGAMAAACVVPAFFLVLGVFAGGGFAMLLAIIAFVVAVPVALAHALALGLPLYLLLRRYLRLTRPGAAIAGFVIGALPIGLGAYSVPLMAAAPVDLEAQLRAALGFGLLGGIGGLAFRHILQRLTGGIELEP
jgi:hypothetical protein